MEYKYFFNLAILYLLMLSPQWTTAQDYTNWITGDTADAEVSGYLPGIVLAGGGGDHDNAMIWMLQRAAGGDVLVLRASGSDGYNPYFFSDLGVEVNSVETIRFDGPGAASDPYVLRRIAEAEVLFFAGGDQFDYYTFWKDNSVEDSIQYLIDEKQITIGGTSAGMAILGQAYYTPSTLGINSDEALNNPYHPYMDILGHGDFLNLPYLENTVTDTHFDQRNRAGRFLTFLARLTTDNNYRAKGIAANEFTAVCIDETGIARCFGEYPEYEEDLIYFAQVNCESPYEPESCQENMPLDWIRNQEAVKVCRIPATWEGENTFDLNDWISQVGGNWFDWYATNGTLTQSPEANQPACTISSVENNSIRRKPVSPNPAQNYLELPADVTYFEIRDMQGMLRMAGKLQQGIIQMDGLPDGCYVLRLDFPDGQNFQRFVKIR
ncbi:MAG: type 1 glutamine amidotransferase-like domain-containing protein [Bacteroidetes bacterium]|nr:type 1 glutamine amidotransferase-like domain-containing protein [Bacteroidota bacterium]